MPELPEVETVKRILAPQLCGRRITAVQLLRPEVVAHPDAQRFAAALTGKKMLEMDRRGKFLLLMLEGGGRLILHLRMTGQLLVTPPDHPKEKHTHLVLELDDSHELRYIDVRRFGRFWLLEAGEEDRYSGIERLGPEPLGPAFCAGYLQEALQSRRRAIKECLLDQSVVAGIGNIYADEILFAARIHPARAACTLGQEEWRRLAEAIPHILRQGIENDRLTPEQYLALQGREYRDVPSFAMYGREGQPCPCCGTPVERIILSGRSSCYCPRCQA